MRLHTRWALPVALFAAVAAPSVFAAINVTVALADSPPYAYLVRHDKTSRPRVYGILADLLSVLQYETADPCVDTTDLSCGVRFQPVLYDSWALATAAFLNGSVQIHPNLPVVPAYVDVGVSFLTPWGTSDLTFLTRQMPQPPSLLYLLQPLDGRSWALTLGSFAIVALSIALFDRFRAGYGPTALAGLSTWLNGKEAASSGSNQALAPSAMGQPQQQQVHQGPAHRIGIREASFRAALALTGSATVPPPSHAQRLAHLRYVLGYFGR